MPGVKTVIWDEATRAKALDVLLAFEPVRASSDTLEKAAAYIGRGCTAKAAHTLFTNIGKRKKDQILAAIPGVDRDSSSPGTSGTSEADNAGTKKAPAQRVMGGRVSKPKSTKAKNGKHIKQVLDEAKLLATPPASSEEAPNMANKRASSRPQKDRDYKALAGEDDDTKDTITAFEGDLEYDYVPEDDVDKLLNE